ncbi:MAG: hypothetical protein VKJ24_08130 [Synechococcales bacterium]|nr:hypothetical protein [Synechococcales bacterium]
MVALTETFSKWILSLGLLVSLGGAIVTLPALAQKTSESLIKPKCEQRGADRWICSYESNPAPDPYKSYEGQLRNGFPNGTGVLVYDNDDRYEGQVKNGIPHGVGMFVFKNNDRYEGQVRNGKPEGKGIFTTAKGDRYTGIMKDGHPHGNGTFVFANGDVFSGRFYLGQAKGEGTFSSKGIRCQGYYFSSQLSGRGTCAYPPGATIKSYTGEFRGGKPDGRGVMVLSDGKRIVGEFRNGKEFNPGLTNR